MPHPTLSPSSAQFNLVNPSPGTFPTASEQTDSSSRSIEEVLEPMYAVTLHKTLERHQGQVPLFSLSSGSES